jgi:hypothetical protein
MNLNSVVSLRKEICKRLDVLAVEAPVFAGSTTLDSVNFLRRHFNDFLKSLKRAGALKSFQYGVNVKDCCNVKIKICLRGDCLTIKTKDKCYLYEFTLRRQ